MFFIITLKMIDGKAENLEEWYKILQETFDKYTLLINNLCIPVFEKNTEEYNKKIKKFNEKRDMYITAQKPYKYYLELNK